MKSFSIIINNKIKKFNKSLSVPGDKSISHRFFLIASQAIGESIATGVLESEDILSTINALKKFGVKIIKKKNKYIVFGNGLNSFKIKKNLSILCNNAGTLARLLPGLLVNYPVNVSLLGDKSLSRRPMSRIIEPLKKFGMYFSPKNKKKLPLKITGSEMPIPITHDHKSGSSQVKSCLMNASILTPGISLIKEYKKSRNHHEIMLKYAGADINIKKIKKYNCIFIRGQKNFRGFNLKIGGDISSAAFLIGLTLATDNSKIIVKNLNINPTRTGIITIFKKMNANIKIKNTKTVCGEKIGDLIVESSNLKNINCPKYLVPYAIDEFPIILLLAGISSGVATIKNIGELNKKESPRLNIMNKILNQIGVKTIIKKDSIKIFGNPNLKKGELKGKYKISSYMKDHRITMVSCIAALVLGGSWNIKNAESVTTSFPSFYKLISKIGGKFEIK